MRVVIHGGMHKTGTTAVQDVLARHRAELAAEGIYYPDFGAPHHEQILNLKGQSWSFEPIRRVIDEGKQNKADLLLFSAECVSTLSDEQFRRLTECFSGHDLKYIFCFRNSLSYLPSRYQQYCKRRDSQTFTEYVRRISTSLHVDVRYDLVLSRALESGACTVSAISYDNAIKTNGNIVSTLLCAAGLDWRLSSTLATKSGKLNVREAWLLTEQKRLLNGIIADNYGLIQDDLCRSMLEHRLPRGVFDIGSRLKYLPADILSEMEAAIEEHKVSMVPEHMEVSTAVELRMIDKFSANFINADRDRLYPVSEAVEVVYAELSWRKFKDLYPHLADTAFEALAFSENSIQPS